MALAAGASGGLLFVVLLITGTRYPVFLNPPLFSSELASLPSVSP